MVGKSVVAATVLILLGSAGVQTSSALSSMLFERYGSTVTSSMRMAIAGVVLLIVFRLKLNGRSRDECLGIAIYGVAMAVMNTSLYVAIERIPLGIAVTLEFLGPCAVVLMSSRHVKEG